MINTMIWWMNLQKKPLESGDKAHCETHTITVSDKIGVKWKRNNGMKNSRISTSDRRAESCYFFT